MFFNLITFLLTFYATANVVAPSTFTPFNENLGREQRWGLLEPREGTRMFYWMFYSHKESTNTQPIIFWIAGGPGIAASGFSNFMELGPLNINQKINHFYPTAPHLVFVDSPVGTGYSWVQDPSFLAKSDRQIAVDFVLFLKQFFKRHPDLKKCPLYLVGEGYGGKSAVQIALRLDTKHQLGQIDFKLHGIALGNPWIAPMNSIHHIQEYLYNMGFLDETDSVVFTKFINYFNSIYPIKDIETELKPKQFYEHIRSLVYVLTKTDIYNVLKMKHINESKVAQARVKKSVEEEEDQIDEDIEPLLKEQEIKEFFDDLDPLNVMLLLHPNFLDSQLSFLSSEQKQQLVNFMNSAMLKVPLSKIKANWELESKQVYDAIDGDFLKPVLRQMERLLNETDIEITVYSGQLDAIVNTPGTVAAIESLNWAMAKEWEMTPRKPIFLNSILQGYEKCLTQLCLYTVLRAGHFVPMDNPEAFDYILGKFIHQTPRVTTKKHLRIE